MSDVETPLVTWQRVTAAAEAEADLLFVPLFESDDSLADVPGLDDASGGEIGRARARGELKGRTTDLFVTPLSGGVWKVHRVALVGAGPRGELTGERLRRVAATAGYAARQRSIASVGFVLRDGVDAVQAAQAAADGLQMAGFDDAAYKKRLDQPFRPLQRVVIVDPRDTPGVQDAIRRGQVIGESVNVARALANEPANVLTPRELAARVSRLGAMAGLRVDVLDDDQIREHGMRLVLAVAQGSAEPPRVIVLRHDPPGAPESPVIGLVGKAVTFDSGGISIKPAEGMDRMKSDMAGGAAVAAAMRAVARLGSPFRVVAVIPATENMPGSRATRPGDVVRGASGTSVEIINTDAEGRLILADALWYVRRLGATHVVDVATLTGAVVIALGRHVSALVGQPDGWVAAVREAAGRAGERVWPLPLYEEVREQLRSEIADLVNSAGRPGGTITAAAFLREFAGDGAWAHLDIAGTSWAETKTPHQPKGPTGVAVRTLIEIAMTAGRSAGRAD